MNIDRQHNRWLSDVCPTGKRGYVERAGAKAIAQQQKKKGDHAIRPYRCPQCDYWHLGHMPSAVIDGRVTADVWFADRNAIEGRPS